MSTRAEVVAEARGWIGTTFHHQARLKGVGVDCAGLVIGVGRSLGIWPDDFDVNGYGRLPDGTTFLAMCDKHLQRIERAGMAPGDVVVVRYDVDPQHIGFLGDYRHGGLSIIHASAIAGRVIETRLMFTTSMRFVAAYRLPGIV